MSERLTLPKTTSSIRLIIVTLQLLIIHSHKQIHDLAGTVLLCSKKKGIIENVLHLSFMKEKQSQMKIFPTPGGGARVAFHPQGQPETTNQ